MSRLLTQTCPVLYGIGAIEEIGDKAKELGAQTVLCIYDGGIAEAGIGGRIVSILEREGLDVYAVSELVPEPPDYQIDNIYNEYKDKGVDLVVGIGGGSSMDTAKAVAYMFTYKYDAMRPHIPRGAHGEMADFPLITVPTCSGTGSEVSNVAVLTDTSDGYKGGIGANVSLAILDPELSRTSPPFITATTGMDAFAHAAEAMTSKWHDPKAVCLGSFAVTNIVKYLKRAVDDGDDMEARNAMSLASNFAGMAFSDSQTHAGHGFAETIGANLHQPHGLCCGLCLPTCMEYVGDNAPELIFPVADAMGIDYSDVAGDGSAVGHRIADAIRQLMRECNVPSFKERGIEKQQILDLVPKFITNFHLDDAPVPFTEQMVVDFATSVYDTYQ